MNRPGWVGRWVQSGREVIVAVFVVGAGMMLVTLWQEGSLDHCVLS